MKLKVILRQMYEITETLNRYVNNYGDFKDGYLCYGKFYQNIEDIEFEEICLRKGETGETEKRMIPKAPANAGAIDFRHKNVDLEIVQDAKEYMINCVNEFCKEYRDGDMQTLFIGCILNLYYSSGLFDRTGCLCVEEIAEGMADAATIQYIGVMEQLMMKEVFSYFRYLRAKQLFTDEKINRVLDLYLKEKKEKYLNEILGYINPNFEDVDGFVEEVIKGYEKFELLEQKYGESNSDLLLELCNINPEYQYANLLLCMDSVEDYINSKGENDGFALYIDKLDEDIFNLGIGKEKPSTYEWKSIDGRIVTTHPMAFSAFGYGFPFMEYYDRYEMLRNLVDKERGCPPVCQDCPCERLCNLVDKRDSEGRKISGSDIKSGVCSYYPKKVGIHIDDSAKLALGLAKAIRDKEKAIYEKKRVIQQFSHTYMNMRATSLYNIATELLKNEDKVYRNYGRKLLYEYSVKKNLTKDVEMLKLRFEDNVEELYNRIADSILSKEQPDGVHIEKLVDDAIIRCMVTLVHDGGFHAKKLRARFENFDWIEIRNNFENEVLLADNKNVREWFRHNMFDLECLVSDKWKGILFEEDSYAALLFIDIISELLTNIFKYADKSRTITLEFRDEEDCMLLAARNYMKDKAEDKKEGGYGLEAETEVVRAVNEKSGMKESPIKTRMENGVFTVELRIAMTLFKR